MRRIRYCVAASLDGYIAGPTGEADWIISDPDIDFGAIWDQFDTLLIGRRTYEAMGGRGAMKGIRSLVFSRTLAPQACRGATLVSGNIEDTVAALREQPGKDIWLFGGGDLFRSLLSAGLVDTVEVGIIPVILGGGIPLIPPPAPRTQLTLTRHQVFGTGIVALAYDVQKTPARKADGRRRSGTRERSRRPMA